MQKKTNSSENLNKNSESNLLFLIVIVVLTVTVFLMIYLWPKSEKTLNIYELSNNNIEFLSSNDQITSLKNYSDKPLIINFYASNCPPCKAEIPNLNLTAKKYEDKIEMIGINADTDKDTWLNFDQELKINYSTYFQPQKQFYNELNISLLPTTLFVKPEGEILKRYTGQISKAKLEEYSNQLLQTPK